MKKIVLLLVLPALLLIGCNNDDDANYEPIGIGGDWKLVKSLHGIEGGSTTFEAGAVTWNFNEDDRKLVITNTQASGYSGPQSGTYNYGVRGESGWCLNTIAINETQLEACFHTENDTLMVSSVLDGPVYKLVR